MDKLIAQFLDKLKINNPKVWSILAILLTGIYTMANTGIDIGFFKLNENSTENKILEFIAFILSLLLQSRTSRYVQNNETITNIEKNEKNESEY